MVHDQEALDAPLTQKTTFVKEGHLPMIGVNDPEATYGHRPPVVGDPRTETLARGHLATPC